MASAYFILAANSWMQHPVGVALVHGKPQTDVDLGCPDQSTLMAALPHTIAGCFAVAATFLVGIAVCGRSPARDDGYRPMWRASLKLGAWVGVIAFAALSYSG